MHLFEAFRKSQNLSQGELGTKLGLPDTTAQGRVSHYETGRNPVPVDVAQRFVEVAKSYGVEHSLDDVYRPVPDEQPEPIAANS